LAPEPAVLAEVRAWLHKASEDVRAAEVARAAQPPLSDAAVFHCQQSAVSGTAYAGFGVRELGLALT